MNVFNQINLIVRDIDAATAFYRLLGVDVADAAEWPPGTGAKHTNARGGNGAALELDNAAMASIWYPGSGGVGGPVIGLSLPSDDAVDETYARAVAAGIDGALPPHVAFWGARYAIVVDPDGHLVGLMGPRDRSRAYTPEAGS